MKVDYKWLIGAVLIPIIIFVVNYFKKQNKEKTTFKNSKNFNTGKIKTTKGNVRIGDDG